MVLLGEISEIAYSSNLIMLKLDAIVFIFR